MIYFVFDIETIRDNQLLRDAGSEKDIEKAEKGEFINPIFHKPICFSFLAFNSKKCLAYKAYVGEEEKIIKSFWEIIGKVIEKNPTFVTFNGKNFDFPVMLVRGIKVNDENTKNVIRHYLDDTDKWEQKKPNYTHRFTKYHIDLIEAFGIKTSLQALCTLFGIPVKTESHGSEVEELYANGELEKIALYCAEDVFATTRLLTIFLHAKTGEKFPFLKDKPQPEIKEWGGE